ncbi:hypothetical protein FOMPIDRAFT_1019322 [Fomitopsis schrenkii]|uniref:F-box domain-containing protein n=1 Tax=Fomitopsis schrenkii TaxID=2126942 RepID=S8F1C4_FOMSC|nr:hypothetical protein FOMPIDRAFT_1019322 [Fomitopsis schrenkii]
MARTILSPCNLAFETWDDIIALLADKPSTLTACALTCQAFLPAARTHLFRVAHIDSPTRLTTLEALLGSSPGLQRNIRTLTVRGRSDGQEDRAADGWAKLAIRLERLTCVRLRGFTLEQSEDVRRTGLPEVTGMWLEGMRSAQDDLRALVLACPKLSTLYINDTSEVTKDTDIFPASRSPSFQHLGTLVWHVPSLPQLLQSRQIDEAPPTLPVLITQHLKAGVAIPLLRLAVGHNLRISAATRSAVKELVSAAGDTVESLVLRLEDLGEGRLPDDIRGALLPDLSGSRRLKTLHILAVGSAWFEIHGGLAAAAHVLSTVPPDQNALQDVIIHLSPYVPSAQRDWGVAAWVQLVDALAVFMRVHSRVRCTLCLDFSDNFGGRPKPEEESHIAACQTTAHKETMKPSDKDTS